MNMEEFERMQHRFGENLSTWPAPYRQEAALFLDGGKGSEDRALDRLILSLPDGPTDQAEFEREVLRQINRRQRVPFVARMRPRFGATASALTLAFMVASLGGYSLAGRNAEMSDGLLFAFAVGEAPVAFLQPFSRSTTDGSSP